MTIINMSGGRAGKTPVYQARTVTPTQFPTTVQPQTGYDALSQVTVNAPANLLAQNIRKDVNIAGVIGTYEATAPTMRLQQKTATPGTASQTVTPDSGYDGLSQVTVSGDTNLTASNIKKGVSIFGVSGSYDPQPSAQSRTVTPTYFPYTVEPQSGYEYLTSAVVNAPANLTAGNIRKGVSIAGVTGTYEGASAMPTISTRVASCAGMHFDNGNAFPVILVGSNDYPTTASDGNTYTDAFPATSVTGCFVRKKWGYYSAGQLSSYASTFAADTAREGYRFFGGYSWSNTARNTTSMDYFLDAVAGDLGVNYFSGTMNCQPYAVTDTGGGYYQWLIASGITFGDDTNVPVNFTYSNGRVTYSISSSDLRDAGNIAFGSKWYWFNTSIYPVSYAKPCLVFSSMLVEI